MKRNIFIISVIALIILANLAVGKPSDDYEYPDFFTTKATNIKSRAGEELEEWDDKERCDLNQKCVSYFLCKEDGVINSDGSFLIDERLGPGGDETPPVESCPNMKMCCLKKDYISEVPVDVCGTGVFPNPTKCGFRNPRGLGGIAVSMQNKSLYSQYAEFPWVVAVMLNTKHGNAGNPLLKMGGSLIHPQVVLTTAHNMHGMTDDTLSKLVIRAGEWDTQSINELCLHEERRVQRVIRHEKFTRDNLRNDLALLVLERELQMTPFINTICLPPKNMNFDGQRCLSGGWGKKNFGNSSIAEVFMKKVELPIVPKTECERMLRQTRVGPDFELHEGFLCAGGEEGKDLCTGDGGSPLVCENESEPGHFYQAGMVVGGIECGRKDVPGFYAQIAKYRDWIDTKMAELDFETSSYTM